MYPNVRKLLNKRKTVIILVSAAFAAVVIGRAIYDLTPRYLTPPPTYVEQAEQHAAEIGEPLSEELRKQMEALDASRQDMPQKIRVRIDPWDYVSIPIGAIFLAICVRYLFFYGLQKSLLAKMITKYTARDGKEDMDGALKALDAELQKPVHHTKQLILTENWLYGHIGLMRTPVAFPLRDIVGVYYYHLMRTGNKARQFFQIVILDKFGDDYVLQLKSKKQLQGLITVVANACPNAMHGNYDDYESFSNMPAEMRKNRIAEVLSSIETYQSSDCS